jgi:hypothetical protein
MENYAAQASKLAADLRCDVVVGHSLGANVALEMVGSTQFLRPGRAALIPSFSRTDESKVLGRLTGSACARSFSYAVMMKLIGPAFKSSLPPHRRDALVAELKKNDPRFLRAQTRHYLGYLDRTVPSSPASASRPCRLGSSLGNTTTSGSPNRNGADSRTVRRSAS